jgi:uncharacterized membrane protein
MDFYTIFKFLHVLTAVAWVGGGLTLLAASIMASRASDSAAMFGGLDVMNRLGKAWFVPASLLTVVFGAITTTIGGMWGDLWVLLGLAGFASTFLTGLLFLEPQGRKIGELIGAGRTEEAMAAGRRLLNISKFDYTVMLVVVADMVLKPYWTDFVVIAIFAVVIVAGLVLFLLPALREETTAAA